MIAPLSSRPAPPETPRWTLLFATAAPVLLIGGWTLAASRRSAHFDSFRDTINALAGRAADDRWIMTCALHGLGACHVLTAFGLRSAPDEGRRVLGFGGCCTSCVASLPLPASPLGSATGHLRRAPDEDGESRAIYSSRAKQYRVPPRSTGATYSSFSTTRNGTASAKPGPS